MRKLHRLAAIAVLAVTAIAGACGDSSGPDDEPGDPNAPANGTFALSSVDTKSLPFAVFSETDYKLEVTAGSAILDTAGTFIMPLTTKETVAGFASTYVDTTRGTWTQAAGTISMVVTPGSVTTTAQWDGRRLTVMFAIGSSTNTYVYTKSR